MTDSQLTESDGPRRVETWRPIPGFSYYQAGDLGHIRSVDRVISGRNLTGRVLKPRRSNRGYLLVNLTDDTGRVQTRTVHTLILSACVGPCPRRMETRHLNDDPTDNRWPENICYGTRPENDADRARNTPPAPVPPPKRCVCGQVVTRGSATRCHDCVVQVGVDAARLLADGMSPADTADVLGYNSAAGVVVLATKYGGHKAVGATANPKSSQRVMATLRHWLRRGDRK